MRTADTDYTLPANLPGDPMVTITVTWEIDLDVEGRGTDEVSLIFKATPLSIQAMIGGMPFSQVEWADVPKQYPFYDWIRARTTDVALEACGYTEQEALREACEEEDNREEESRQIGRPI